jgi:hypothetical protein
MRKLLTTSLVAMFAVSSAAPLFAQEQPAQKKTRDPNEVVCERQEELGSRLGGTKVCKTRAEWAEERRLSRQDIDKVQTQRGTSGGN